MDPTRVEQTPYAKVLDSETGTVTEFTLGEYDRYRGLMSVTRSAEKLGLAVMDKLPVVEQDPSKHGGTIERRRGTLTAPDGSTLNLNVMRIEGDSLDIDNGTTVLSVYLKEPSLPNRRIGISPAGSVDAFDGDRCIGAAYIDYRDGKVAGSVLEGFDLYGSASKGLRNFETHIAELKLVENKPTTPTAPPTPTV